MKKVFLIPKNIKTTILSVCILLFVTVAFAQTKSKIPAKQVIPELQKLLTPTGLPYKMMNDSLAIIPYEGDNIASYNVIIRNISDLFIVYTNLTEALPGKIDESKSNYLLQQNNYYDVVKIGMSADDNIVSLRADLYKSATNAVLLKRIIEQVANVTNIIGGDLNK